VCVPVHSREILVGIVTRIRAGRYTVRIPVWGRNFCLSSRTFEAHPPSYSVSAWVLFREYSSQGVTLTTNLHLVLRLRMAGVEPCPLPLALQLLMNFDLLSNFLPRFSIRTHLTASPYLRIYHILSDIIRPALTSVYQSSPLWYSFHRPLCMNSYNTPIVSYSVCFYTSNCNCKFD
jgi:hypothetical protein